MGYICQSYLSNFMNNHQCRSSHMKSSGSQRTNSGPWETMRSVDRVIPGSNRHRSEVTHPHPGTSRPARWPKHLEGVELPKQNLGDMWTWFLCVRFPINTSSCSWTMVTEWIQKHVAQFLHINQDCLWCVFIYIYISMLYINDNTHTYSWSKNGELVSFTFANGVLL